MMEDFIFYFYGPEDKYNGRFGAEWQTKNMAFTISFFPIHYSYGYYKELNMSVIACGPLFEFIWSFPNEDEEVSEEVSEEVERFSQEQIAEILTSASNEVKEFPGLIKAEAIPQREYLDLNIRFKSMIDVLKHGELPYHTDKAYFNYTFDEPKVDKYGDIDFDPEEHGWVESCESYTKVIDKVRWVVFWNHHGHGVIKDSKMIEVNPLDRRFYRPCNEALAWEIENGIYQKQCSNQLEE